MYDQTIGSIQHWAPPVGLLTEPLRPMASVDGQAEAHAAVRRGEKEMGKLHSLTTTGPAVAPSPEQHGSDCTRSRCRSRHRTRHGPGSPTAQLAGNNCRATQIQPAFVSTARSNRRLDTNTTRDQEVWTYGPTCGNYSRTLPWTRMSSMRRQGIRYITIEMLNGPDRHITGTCHS